MAERNNIFTIASRTGYSPTTVSRVLTGQAEKYRISSKAVELVTMAARELNYQPDLVAQTLRHRQPFLRDPLRHHHQPAFFAGLSHAAGGLAGD